MEISGQGIAVYIFALPLLALFLAGLWKLYTKAGRKGWETIVPVYNIFIWLKIIHRPWWWFILLCLPVVGFIMMVIMLVELLNVFGKRKLADHALGILFSIVYIPYIAFDKRVKYKGPADRSKAKRSATREWTDAIVFAVIAATIIRTFIIEAFTIPTSSMEKSLLIGDFLFVSKVSYGPRVPNTPIAFPFAHHTLPIIPVKSYIDWSPIPYWRLPGYTSVKNNDIVVFNYPMEGFRPVDKRENYIKRCVAIPGDTLQVDNRRVIINGRAAAEPEYAQYYNEVKTTPRSVFSDKALARIGITEGGPVQSQAYDSYEFILSKESAEQIRQFPFVTSVKVKCQPKGQRSNQTFPQSQHYNWNIDNYGPLVVPRKGMTVEISRENIALYKRIIGFYEGHALDDSTYADKILIDGKEAGTYTFGMDYYFMMGDNRHNSLDSRFWGFVPGDHIVGKAVFIWMSWNSNGRFQSKIRWDRLFTFISSDGLSRPYFLHFIIGIALIAGATSFLRRRRKT